MIIASSWVGLTFPGIIEEPGSLDGMFSSCKPAVDRMKASEYHLQSSLAQPLVPAMPRTHVTIPSRDPRAANLFGALINGWLVSRAISAASLDPKSGKLLSPVPTAVPPGS